MTHAETPRAALMQARILVGALVAGVLALLAVSGLFQLGDSLRFLVLPAGLVGLVSPVIGHKLYTSRRDGTPADADVATRCRRFVMATILALAITEAAALFGVVVFMLSGRWTALTGVLTHVLLAGAIWPSPDRLQPFLGSSAPTPTSG
jgi:hypothetical protein